MAEDTDTKAKIDSLKTLKSQMRSWKKQDIRKKVGKQAVVVEDKEHEKRQEDLLTAILRKLVKD